MKKTLTSLKGLLAIPVLAFAFAAVVPVAATYADASGSITGNCDSTNLGIDSGVDCAKGNGQQEQLDGSSGVIKKITDVLLFIIGAVAVIMLVIGGIRYTISGGDSSQVTAAKNTILYAIIGIVVAILAYAIISFVTGSFSSTTA